MVVVVVVLVLVAVVVVVVAVGGNESLPGFVCPFFRFHQHTFV